jgi:zinc transport system substrate-binding protein
MIIASGKVCVSQAFQTLRRGVLSWILFAVAALITASCQKQENSEKASAASKPEKASIAVSIPPLEGLVHELSDVPVISLVAEGANPHHFDPAPRHLQRVSKSSVLFTAGLAELKPVVEKLQAKGLQTLSLLPQKKHSLDEHLNEEHSEAPNPKNDSHGDHDAHEHMSHHPSHHGSSHQWMSLDHMKYMAEEAASYLKEQGEDSLVLFNNLTTFHGRLDSLRKELSPLVDSAHWSKVMVFHSAFGEFLEQFEWEQVAIEEGGRESSAKRMQQLIDAKLADQKREEKHREFAPFIIIQPQHDPTAARQIAEKTGSTLITLNPLAADPFWNYQELKKVLADLAAGESAQ